MGKDFYDRLSDESLLHAAWHLARHDSRGDFMQDPLRFSDFAARLKENIQGISTRIENTSYRPHPLQVVDVPKSGLSVRPGTVFSIEDKIVMFGIARLIAPPFDAQMLSPAVYSYRVKKKYRSGDATMFEDEELLRFPFLKGQTIRKRIDILEPWYGAWPRYIRKVQYAFEEEGYNYLVVADIAAYFENIDLGLLREILLGDRTLVRQPRIVNFLVSLLEYWTLPSFHGRKIARGIPQGNAVCSFLGNAYLKPLDDSIGEFARGRSVKYFRYVDDVKILTRDMATAREVLFRMNETLRGLRLNIQSSKTQIKVGREVREDLFDARMDVINQTIDTIRGKRLTMRSRKSKLRTLRMKLGALRVPRKGKLVDRDLRVFRRLMTGFNLLEDSGMTTQVLQQMRVNPDYRLLRSAVSYLRNRSRNLAVIPKMLERMLTQREGLFDYQRASLYQIARHMRALPSRIWSEARRDANLKKLVHWYVRQQAVFFLGLPALNDRRLAYMKRLFHREAHSEVRRAYVQGLSQLPSKELVEIVTQLERAVDAKLQRLGVYCHLLMTSEVLAQQRLASLLNNLPDDMLLERYYEIDLIAHSKDAILCSDLRKRLLKQLRDVRFPVLRKRIRATLNRLGWHPRTKGRRERPAHIQTQDVGQLPLFKSDRVPLRG